MKNIQGFNLIELVVFIIVLGIATVGIMMSFRTALETSADIATSNTALEITQGRLEIIIGQYKINGFNSFSDICSGSGTLPAVCTIPNGYTVTTSISNWPLSSSTFFKLITVSTEDASGARLARLRSLVAKY